MKTLPSLVTAGLIVFSSTSHGSAVEQDWGAIAITGSFPCFGAPCTETDLGGLAIDNVTGGPGETVASSTLTQPNANGTAEGTVTLAGSLNVPLLQGLATGTADGGALTVVMGSTLYEYNPEKGDTSGTVEITVDLDADIANAGLSQLTGVGVAAGLFDAEGFVLPDPTTGLEVLLAFFAVDSLPDAQKVEFNQQGVTGMITDSDTMTLTDLVAGDQFFLFGGLIAIADGDGRSADAFNTVTMEVTQGAGSLTVVPIPAPVVLLSSALGLLLLRQRS